MGQLSRFCCSQKQEAASQQIGLSTELSWRCKALPLTEHCSASVKSTSSWLQAPTDIQTEQSQQLSGSWL